MKFAFCHRVVNGAAGKNNTIKRSAKTKQPPQKKKQTNNWEQHILRSHLVGPHHVLGGHLKILSSNEQEEKNPPKKKVLRRLKSIKPTPSKH